MHRLSRFSFIVPILVFICADTEAKKDISKGDNACGKCLEIKIDCSSTAKKISPLIYGVAFNARKNHEDKSWLYELNPSSRRWGGNPTSRYNWRINSWNTAQDWFFKNVRPGDSFVFNEDFLMENNVKDIVSYITLPMIGWVSKDSYSGSYPLSVYASQDKFDVSIGFGNGKWKNKKIPTKPEYTSKKMDDSDLVEWVNNINSRSSETPIFALGNEPMLWNHTHHDVHSEPAGYEEVFQKSIKVAKAVKNNSKSLVAGPASWGWTSYFYSSLDMETGVQKGVDQIKYEKPFLEWFLGKFREYESHTGVRLLDALDVHYYPQAPGVFQGEYAPDLRWRSTKSLWDESYVDESWINEPVFLLPRMRRIIRNNYPDTKLIIGEYSFGETSDVSSALAMAESLGTFAHHGVYAAYYWVYPGRYTPTYWGFRMFRNYDGMNSSFAENLIGVSREDRYSEYVSISEDKNRATVVVINANEIKRKARLNFRKCSDVISTYYFDYNGIGGIKKKNTEENIVINEKSVGLIEVNFKAK